MTHENTRGWAQFDSHCHLDFPEFDADRQQVLDRCRAQGLAGMLIPGIEPAQWARALQLARSNAGFCAAAGLHPWWVAAQLDAGYDEQALQADIAAIAGERHLRAIGECGLDAAIDCPLERQIPVFEWHLRIADIYALPLVIHVVRCHADVLALLKQHRPKCGGVIHAFSGSQEIAQQYCDLGFKLGVGGTITYERAAKTRRAVAAVSLESLLLETDAPSMPLSGHQGQRNSPQMLPQVLDALAQLRQESVECIARTTTQNARDLFGLTGPDWLEWLDRRDT
ncbi:TatD family hydrolase [Biformimicrobium ophioploci]|uniref:TatD family hydrolase n=1 Tax=Biformimicrobium ophioploci TaxID=3036711 RepID=A0ABQ6M2B0_9GAMM|nr:TatD family hydrolase [Microbulbifer sp. NKW57]GMG88480.1 TatD family hydrolase [Microbulbifer sp. NKW57]